MLTKRGSAEMARPPEACPEGGMNRVPHGRDIPQNRLISMEARADLESGLPRWKYQFTYDYMGRRIQKTSHSRDDAQVWNNDADERFVYDGWNLIRASGDAAHLNPFRFSTKYHDEETGLYYYGYRYYSPSVGRFLNRDPIEENGGINLYKFVSNDPVNRWDWLGLCEQGYRIKVEDNSMGFDQTHDGRIRFRSWLTHSLGVGNVTVVFPVRYTRRTSFRLNAFGSASIAARASISVSIDPQGSWIDDQHYAGDNLSKGANDSIDMETTYGCDERGRVDRIFGRAGVKQKKGSVTALGKTAMYILTANIIEDGLHTEKMELSVSAIGLIGARGRGVGFSYRNTPYGDMMSGSHVIVEVDETATLSCVCR